MKIFLTFCTNSYYIFSSFINVFTFLLFLKHGLKHHYFRFTYSLLLLNRQNLLNGVEKHIVEKTVDGYDTQMLLGQFGQLAENRVLRST